MRNIEISESERIGLKSLISSAPEQGYSLIQIKIGLSVLNKLECEGCLSLEETEWEFLCERIKNARWRVASQDILDMTDKVFNTKKD